MKYVLNRLYEFVPRPVIQILFAVFGIAYAACYGLFTLLSTGGGHGNFIWVELFVAAHLVGFFIPGMAFLSFELANRTLRRIYVSLLSYNLAVSLIALLDWVTETGFITPRDFSAMLMIFGASDLVLFGLLHFSPTILFAIILLRARHSKELIDDEILIGLKLQ